MLAKLRSLRCPRSVLACGLLAAATDVAAAQRLLYSVDGNAAFDQLGIRIRGLPDVNGDGVPDLLVGAIFEGGSGAARIASGVDGSLLHACPGGAPYEEVGASVASAGDLDGDGVGDALVGAPLHAAAGFGAGAVRAYSSASGALLYTVIGHAAFDNFGDGLAGLGDVDGDGRADFVAGAPGADPNGAESGRAYVIRGANGSIAHVLDGLGAGDVFGYASGGLGDVDGDGAGDVVVGAFQKFGATVVQPAPGYARVYSGASGALLHHVGGATPGDVFGISVAGVGDVDGDGVGDFAAGAPESAVGGLRAGRVLVHSGASGAQLLALSGDVLDAQLGYSVHGAGDVDLDGVPDLLAGAPFANGLAFEAGSFHVYSGASGARIGGGVGTSAEQRLGYAVSGAGDVDQDGRADLALGSPRASGVGTYSGRFETYASCRGASAAYGSGLAGAGGIAPRLATSGCPDVGASIQLHVLDGSGGASGLLLVGTQAIALPVGPATLHVWPLAHFPYKLDGASGVAGAGHRTFALQIPADPALAGQALCWQAGHLDAQAVGGIAATPGLRWSLQ
ncbi:MAG: hypothetical protein EPO68_16205 [Planctomycetota bacterium]|nr:MAG: hypothetical protein EPO68_16205 [Planctomycetota bacterium]